MFQLICKDGHARRGAFTTPHGTVQTPVFMNVGTQAAIKGALSAEDLETIGCQVELSNTYHLHVRPGDELIRDLGAGAYLKETLNVPLRKLVEYMLDPSIPGEAIYPSAVRRNAWMPGDFTED